MNLRERTIRVTGSVVQTLLSLWRAIFSTSNLYAEAHNQVFITINLA